MSHNFLTHGLVQCIFYLAKDQIEVIHEYYKYLEIDFYLHGY